MKGFKNTGRGPKSGHSFSSKAGFTGSTGRTQNVRGYTRGVPGKKAFANGGMVVAKGTDGGSALTRRNKPVTGFDQEAGGKSPLRPGFSHGGKACYAEGGKVQSLGAAISMVKRLMAQGNSAEMAADKAARRFNVPKSDLSKQGQGGGGLPADKQMLAKGGQAKLGKGMISRLVTQAQAQAAQQGQAPQQASAPPRRVGLGQAMGRVVSAAAQGNQAPPQTGVAPRGRLGAPIGRAVGAVQQGFAARPAPQGQKVSTAAHHGGYGSFGRRPVVG